MGRAVHQPDALRTAFGLAWPSDTVHIATNLALASLRVLMALVLPDIFEYLTFWQHI